MFDIGGWEFLVIVVLAIVIIGPKDLPGVVRTVAGWVRKARALAREFQSGLDDIAREVELDKVENEIKAGIGLDELGESANSIRREIEDSVDPTGEIGGTFDEVGELLDAPPAGGGEGNDEENEQGKDDDAAAPAEIAADDGGEDEAVAPPAAAEAGGKAGA